MNVDDDGWEPVSRFPSLHEELSRFSGSVAIAAEPLEGLTVTVTIESTDDQPWAIAIGYVDAAGHVLTVRTVRSTQDMNPRALPVEDLGSAMVNFRNSVAASSSRSPHDAASEAHAGMGERIAASRLTRREVASTQTTPIAISIDNAQVEGPQVLVAGYAAVQLPWREQTIFCAGHARLVSALRLRMVRPQDLDTFVNS